MITVTTREDFLREVKNIIPPNPTCVELGVLHGDFSQMILDILQPKNLILIDPFTTNDEKKYEDGLPTLYSTEQQYFDLQKRFEKKEEVVVYRNTSYYSVDSFTDRFFDFIYHDASHLYDDVKRDLEDWLPKIKDDGIIAGHDYAEINDFGVVQAVNEFIQEYNFEMIILNQNGGDFSLKRK